MINPIHLQEGMILQLRSIKDLWEYEEEEVELACCELYSEGVNHLDYVEVVEVRSSGMIKSISPCTWPGVFVSRRVVL